MITQELISYIRGEINKGKTREQVKTALLSGGGWSEADVSEAFRDVMPLEIIKSVPVPAPVVAPISPTITPARSTLGAYVGSAVPVPAPMVTKLPPAHPIDTSTFRPAASNLYPQPKKTHHFKGLIIFLIIIFLVIGGGYFYRAEAGEFLSSIKDGLANLFERNETTPEPMAPVATAPAVIIPPPPVKPVPTSPINCGETSAPDPQNPLAYKDDPVLNCIGASAVSCQWAQATLTNPLYPSRLEIMTSNDLPTGECAFRLAYPLDSKLVSVTGKVMAGESIACPLNIVKSFTEGPKGISTFGAPNKDKASTYGAEIFFYGTAGVFIEYGLDKKKIEFAGCNGRFMDFVIDSYALMQSEQ